WGPCPSFSPPKRALPSIPSAACHSRSTAPRSSPSSTSTAQIRSRTPSLHPRWNQRWTELSSPNFSGNWFHWRPERGRKMRPLNAARPSIRLRPPLRPGGGGASPRRRGVLQEDRLDPLPEGIGGFPDGVQRLDVALLPSQGRVS